MEKLIEEFSIGLFFWQTVIFLLLIWLLKKYAWTPILNTINDREEGIKNALESAEKAREEIKTLKASNDKVLKEAKIERDNILKEANNLKKSILKKLKLKLKQKLRKSSIMPMILSKMKKKLPFQKLKNKWLHFQLKLLKSL